MVGRGVGDGALRAEGLAGYRRTDWHGVAGGCALRPPLGKR